jgi:hypothetical protein
MIPQVTNLPFPAVLLKGDAYNQTGKSVNNDILNISEHKEVLQKAPLCE